MRIVYVLTSLGMGGAERQVLALAGRMAARGHTVALMVLRPKIREEWPALLDVFHLEMHRTVLSVCLGLNRGHKFLREFRPDIVHSHSFHANFVARLLRFSFPHVIVVSTVHNVYEGGRARMLAYRLTDFLSAQTTAVSAAAAERFVRLKAVPRRKCIVVNNGIDIEEFSPSEERRVHMRSEMNVANEFVWLAAGRVVPAKDYPNLLRAFKIVRATHPEAELWIAGESGAPGSRKTSGFVTVSGSFQNVRWLGLRRDLPALLDAADGFVLASAWEGMPLVVGEAMAMQKPVVATDVGGVRELVGDIATLVPPADSERLALAMIEMMGELPATLEAVGRAARHRIASEFSMAVRAGEWEKLYQDRLARRP
jgi:glycosyltransferase involved in cell wall biosynthesis